MSAPLGFQKLVSSRWPIVGIEALQAKGRHMFVGGPFGSNLTSKDYVSTPGVPVIRGTNLGGHDSRFVEDEFAYVSKQKAKELSQNSAARGDLIFTQRGTLGQVALIPSDSMFEEYIISQSQMRLTVDKERVDPRYVYHYFRSPIARAVLKSHIQATGVPHINLGILKKFPIPLPPLAEQKRIAGILDKADAIRRKRQRAIELTEQFLRSTFLQMFGDPVTNPKGLQQRSLGEIVEFVSGGTPSKSNPAYWDGDFPWVSPKDMKTVQIMDAMDHVTDIAFEETTLKRVPVDSILVVIRGMILAHTVPVSINRRSVAINQDMKALLPADGYRAEFVLWALRCQHDFILSRVATAAHGTKRLEVDELKALKIPDVSLVEQGAFLETCARHRQLKGRTKESLTNSDNLFNSLVQRAFRGQL